MTRILPVFVLACIVAWTAVISGEPVPDSSEKCLSCKTKVTDLATIWTNATTVAEILANLDTECIQKYSEDKAKVQLCKDIANVFVQIPPSIFSGMDDLAWPLPDGLCANLYQCELACCGANDPPEQVHLSFVSDDHSLRGVSWVSLSDKRSVVQYGTARNAMTNEQTGDISTYKASGWKGTIHRAVMTDLKPDTTYYYRVGNGLTRWSPVLSFKTLSTPQESSSDVINYAILADMDFESNATMANLQTLVNQGKVDAVIHSGDISYADGYEPHWDLFFNRMQGIASAVPYMATPGNHEFWYNFTSYKKRFLLPGDTDEIRTLLGSGKTLKDSNIATGSHDGMFYSWTVGPVHFIAGNTETIIDTANFAPEFITWVEQDLQQVDRSKTPFVVIHFHRPLYCSNSNRCTDKGGDLLRSEIEDILLKYQVNLVIAGHVHSYERTYPMYQSQATSFDYEAPTAPVYILQGASGNREGNDGFPTDLPNWSVGHSQEVGYGILSASTTELKFAYYASHFDNEGGPVLLDEFTMKPWAAAKK